MCSRECWINVWRYIKAKARSLLECILDRIGYFDDMPTRPFHITDLPNGHRLSPNTIELFEGKGSSTFSNRNTSSSERRNVNDEYDSSVDHRSIISSASSDTVKISDRKKKLVKRNKVARPSSIQLTNILTCDSESIKSKNPLYAVKHSGSAVTSSSLLPLTSPGSLMSCATNATMITEICNESTDRYSLSSQYPSTISTPSSFSVDSFRVKDLNEIRGIKYYKNPIYSSISSLSTQPEEVPGVHGYRLKSIQESYSNEQQAVYKFREYPDQCENKIFIPHSNLLPPLTEESQLNYDQHGYLPSTHSPGKFHNDRKMRKNVVDRYRYMNNNQRSNSRASSINSFTSHGHGRSHHPVNTPSEVFSSVEDSDDDYPSTSTSIRSNRITDNVPIHFSRHGSSFSSGRSSGLSSGRSTEPIIDNRSGSEYHSKITSGRINRTKRTRMAYEE